jgi:phage-related protein
MSIWDIVFFPPSSERYSPYDYITGLSDPAESRKIRHRLEALGELEIGDWPSQWVKIHTGDIWQLKADPHRVMFCLDHRTIVVLHAFRKVGQRTRRKDVQRAMIHYNMYIE